MLGGSEIKDEPKTMAVNASKPQNLQQPAQTITEPDSKALAFESDLKEPLNANKPEIKIEDRGQKDPIQPNKRQQPQEHQGKKTWANVATNQPAPVANRKSSPPPKQPQQQRQNELQKGTSQQGNKDQRPQQQQQQYNKQPYRKPQDQQNQQPFGWLIHSFFSKQQF